MTAKTHLFVKIVFGVVLAILITSFFNVGISLFYPEPEWNDFCDEFAPRMIPDGQQPSEEQLKKEKQCNEDFREASDLHDRIVFLVLAPVGIILLIIGSFVANLTIQITLMGSGFLNVVIGILRNIQDKISVFITITILIVILVVFVLKKFRD